MQKPGVIDRLNLIKVVGRISFGCAFAGGGFAIADGIEAVTESVAGKDRARRITLYA